MDARARAAASLTQAKLELDRALAEIDAIRTFDPSLIGLVAHALGNSITVTVATVEMLQRALDEHADPDVPVWLEGIRHAADLMQHTVGRLVTVSAPDDFPLKFDYLQLPVFMARACDYHRRRSEPAQIRIVCEAADTVPLVRADRVALAIVVDNLLSNAVRCSEPSDTVDVRMLATGRSVVCRIRDEGRCLAREERVRLFERLPVATRQDLASPIDTAFAIAQHFLGRMGGDLWYEEAGGAAGWCCFRLPAIADVVV